MPFAVCSRMARQITQDMHLELGQHICCQRVIRLCRPSLEHHTTRTQEYLALRAESIEAGTLRYHGDIHVTICIAKHCEVNRQIEIRDRGRVVQCMLERLQRQG